MESIKQTYRLFLQNNFAGLKLRKPLFYSWDYGLRFDLQDKKLTFQMYDDRGLDVIAADKEILRPIYKKHNDLILGYDRERIDKQFK